MILMSKQSQRGVLDVLVDGILSKQVGDGEGGRMEDMRNLICQRRGGRLGDFPPKNGPKNSMPSQCRNARAGGDVERIVLCTLYQGRLAVVFKI